MRVAQAFPEMINFPFFMAPMVGLSHIAMRDLVKHYTPGNAKTLWPTEMLNTRRMMVEKMGETPETLKLDFEDDLIPQILGNDERFIAPGVQKLEAWGAKAIDINMGCPVQKALKHNYGVALMGDISYAKEVVAMTTRNTNLPVTVKLRAGIQKDSDFLLNFVNAIKDAGASWVCLHPRSASQKRRGYADWDQIKLLKENISIPIIGNGDVQTASDAFSMLSQTNCDGVMMGRSLTARPWLMWQIGEELGFENPPGKIGLAPRTPEEEAQEYGVALVYFIDSCARYFDESQAMRKSRFFIRNSYGWLNYGQQLIKIASKSKTIIELKNEIIRFFESPYLAMSPRTELRY